METPRDYQFAFAQADQILPGAFANDATTLARYARSTGVTSRAPVAVAYPTKVEQVQQLVGWAGRHGIGLYPISRGKNWGYGDAQPSGENQVVVDLSRMNRIVEVNEELAYCVIEPGVSQQQLYEYLTEHHGNRLWMDATGAGLDASLVGNTLDRGFGHTRYGDHFQTCCGMEVVLADGRVLHTGLGHFKNARAHRVYPYGVGPYLDGLFVQSNLGIVTQIGLWLMPKPEAYSAFFFFADHEDDLAAVVDKLAPLRRQGLLQSTIHIANDLRILSARTRYPFDKTGGKTPLPPEVRAALRNEHTVAAWTGAGALYGTNGTVKAMKKTVKAALHPFRVVFLDEKRLAMAHRLRRFLGLFGGGQKLEQTLRIVEPVYGLMKGIPSNEPRRGATWRVRDPDPGMAMDPLDAHAGIMWASPVLPNRGSDAAELMKLVTPIYEKHGFEPLATFTMITERAMVCVTNVSFDRRIAKEARHAIACYEELMPILIKTGFVPYRTSANGYIDLHPTDVFGGLAREIKSLFDPKNFISPCRYLSSTPVPLPIRHRIPAMSIKKAREFGFPR